jgi:hypothetical protein
MKTNHLKLFVGHKKPDFPIWDGFDFYELPSQEKRSTHGLFKHHLYNDKIYNEYASLFLINRQIQESKRVPEFITICQYRRFVFNKKIGQKSKLTPWCTVLTYDQLSKINVHELYLPRNDQSYLIGSIINVPSIIDQYASAHFLRDILRFTSILIDLEILSDAAALNFLKFNLIIPAPSCGTFPANAFVNLFNIIENAAKGFWNNGYRPYGDEYQSRVMGFLLERLNSFLLINHPLIINSKKDLIGFTTLAGQNIDDL